MSEKYMCKNPKINLTPIMLDCLERIVNVYLAASENNDIEDLQLFLDEFDDEALNFFHTKACIAHLGRHKVVTRAITGVSEKTIYRKCDKK